VQRNTGLSLFTVLEAAAKRESEFRADLPDAQDEQALRARLSRLGDILKDLMQHPAFLTDVLNLQRGLATPEPYYDLPGRSPSRVFQVMRQAKVVLESNGYSAVFEGGKIPLGATYPAVEWLLTQRHFSLVDALARHSFLQTDEFTRVLDALARAGVIAETEFTR
jgi:hypothetical protein